MTINESLPGIAKVCFYAGNSLPCLAVRWDTQRPGQAWKDVPAHCAVVLDGWLYEYVATGYQIRPVEPADLVWSVEVPLTDLYAARRQARADTGRYNWWVIAVIALARLLPDRWIPCSLKTLHLSLQHICSLFAITVLEDGGWRCPAWLAHQYCPASPNDLWWALKPSLAGENANARS